MKMNEDPSGPLSDLGLAPGALRVQVTRERDSLVIVLCGELALDSAPLLKQTLIDAENSGAGRVVVDLRELEFLDSAGLHVLVDGRRRLCERGQELVLRRGPRAVQRMFELTGAEADFSFVE